MKFGIRVSFKILRVLLSKLLTGSYSSYKECMLLNKIILGIYNVLQTPEDKIPELQSEMNYIILNVEQVESTKGPTHMVRLCRPLGVGEVASPYIILKTDS